MYIYTLYNPKPPNRPQWWHSPRNYCTLEIPGISKDRHAIQFSNDQLQEFWDHWKANMDPHPATSSKKLHTPIGISGDDTQYSLAGAKAYVMVVNFILHDPAPGDQCRFPWCILRHELSVGPATLDPIMRVCTWSLNVCHVGIYPRLGATGEPLQGARATKSGQAMEHGPWSVTEMRGDWKYHWELWRLRRFYNSNHLCMFCDACKKQGDTQWP